jgi:(1->4)-alpha-D-glucan 1-alpha-D-glucosylmutase
VRAVLSPARAPEFLADLARLATRVSRPGLWNALSRTLIQLTSPGTPDIYQGDELWNFLLVDPDNRRPVDFDRRRALLEEVVTRFGQDRADRRAFLREIVAAPEDGRIKLHVMRSALDARRLAPDLFTAGYEPLAVTGPEARRVLAYLRRSGGAAALIAAPRLIASHLAQPGNRPPPRAFWSGTRVTLPPGLESLDWGSPLTGQRVAPGAGGMDVADLFDTLPVALLLGRASST